MTLARRLQFDAERPPWLHCISRCVRRAYLCGEDHAGRDVSHRKSWVEQRLRLIAGAAAVEVAGYAVMSNHLHVVLRLRPDLAVVWSAREVVERWLALWPRERLADGTAVTPTAELVQSLAGNAVQVAIWRQRLADLGWCMKALKEDLSRRANKEDRCSGAFWEGRYRSVPLLDQAALTACMAYVDLNPIRAGVADRPERARFTSIYARIKARQALRAAARLRRSGRAAQAEAVLAKAGLVDVAATVAVRQDKNNRRTDPGSAAGAVANPVGDADRATWLTPVALCVAGDGRPLDLDSYLELADATGRLLRGDKRGSIPARLAPILARLDLDLDRWLACMQGFRQFVGSAAGTLVSRVAEAMRRAACWVQNRCALFVAASRAA